MYQYDCEKHGPWSDQHANRRATYDCPMCDKEQRTRYASLYHREVLATQLLQVSLDPTQSEVTMRLARNLANKVATEGTATATGWLDGWWYASGNNHPDNNAAWKLMRSILGAV